MTEQITERTRAEGAEERPNRCPVGSKAGHPCWREANKQAFSEAPHYEVCAEHYRVIHLGRELDELRDQLDNLGAWIATWDDPKVGETRLKYHAFTMRSRMLEEFWHATVKAAAAEFIADCGPEEEPLTFEQEKRRQELALQSNALSDARLLFEDLQAVPEEALGSLSRWHLAAALHQAAEEGVNAEWDRYAREMGLR